MADKKIQPDQAIGTKMTSARNLLNRMAEKTESSADKAICSQVIGMLNDIEKRQEKLEEAIRIEQTAIRETEIKAIELKHADEVKRIRRDHSRSENTLRETIAHNEKMANSKLEEMRSKMKTAAKELRDAKKEAAEVTKQITEIKKQKSKAPVAIKPAPVPAQAPAPIDPVPVVEPKTDQINRFSRWCEVKVSTKSNPLYGLVTNQSFGNDTILRVDLPPFPEKKLNGYTLYFPWHQIDEFTPVSKETAIEKRGKMQ